MLVYVGLPDARHHLDTKHARTTLVPLLDFECIKRPAQSLNLHTCWPAMLRVTYTAGVGVRCSLGSYARQVAAEQAKVNNVRQLESTCLAGLCMGGHVWIVERRL